jgi:hypothetical protein
MRTTVAVAIDQNDINDRFVLDGSRRCGALVFENGGEIVEETRREADGAARRGARSFSSSRTVIAAPRSAQSVANLRGREVHARDEGSARRRRS